MSIRDNAPAPEEDRPERDTSGVASGQHQGLRRPSDDQEVEQALHDVDLQDQGESVEDRLRDRRSSGTPPREGGGD